MFAYYLDPALGYSFQKTPAVGFTDDPAVEHNNDPAVGFISDKPAEALFEFYDRRRQLVIKERVFPFEFYLLDPALYQRMVGNGKRQTDDDHIRKTFPRHIDPLPETVRSEKNASLISLEFL